MTWIIIFLAFIAVAELGSLVLNVVNRTLTKSIELLTHQLEQERESYNTYRTRFEKELATQKDATNLWAKKYFELEILLKKAEHNIQEEEQK